MTTTTEQETAALEQLIERAARAETRSWIDRVPQWVSVTVLGAALIGAWQFVVSLELVPAILLPGPGETFDQIRVSATEIFTYGHVGEALWITTQEIIWGFLAAAILGFFLGVVVGETNLGRKAMMPYLVAFNALPKVAFAPVFVAWWGFGLESKIAMALFLAFFPVIVGTAAGLAAVDGNSLMLFRAMRATRWQTLTQLKLPHALPYIFAGLKSAAVFAVVGAVVGEYLGGGGGLGELIRLSAQYLDLARVFALIFYLGVIGIAVYALVGWAEGKAVFWNRGD